MHEVLQVKDRDLLCRTLLKDPSGQLQNNHDYRGIFSKIQSNSKERIVWNYLFDNLKDLSLICHRKKDLTVFGSASQTILRLT